MPQKQLDIIRNLDKVWLIKPDESLEIASHGDGEPFTLDEIRRLLNLPTLRGGGSVEIHWLFEGWTDEQKLLYDDNEMVYTIMVVNEDAQLLGMPINNVAVAVWTFFKGYQTPIAGDVVVMPAKLFPE